MYKTLDSFNFKNKTVLVRIDINSEVKNKKITPSERLFAPLRTINELRKKKAKIVLLAHQGRKGNSDFINLKQHAKYLKVKFINDIIGNKAIHAIKSLKPGQVILLDNVRKLNDELNPSKHNIITKTLVPLLNYYVNDAFSVSHRNQTSITEFPKYLKSCIGRTMENELKHLNKLKMKNTVYILGGAKPEDVALLMKKKHVLTAGVPAIVALLKKGHNLGAENDRKDKSLYSKIGNVIVPVDLAINMNGKRKELKLSQFPSKYRALDIGTETINNYVKIIKNAKSVFLKGPPGYYSIKGFEKGTREILKAMEKTKAFTVISGGHTTTALEKFKIKKSKISYISLSGGALVYYLAGKTLPGLEALR